jgi:hypothetical protein
MRAQTAPRADLLVPLRPPAPERFGFLAHEGELLYLARHAPRGARRLRAVLAGPFGLERQLSYGTWLRWARTLAANGVEVLRFDYRATGESTGLFERFCLSDFRDDLVGCIRFLESDGGGPTLLMGLRVGALLAAEAFESGEGDALLLWDPPAGGRQALHEVLRRKLASDAAERAGGPRRTRQDFAAELMAGRRVEVEGHPWSRRLWVDAARHALRLPSRADPRPWQVVNLGSRSPTDCPAERVWAISIPRPPFWWHGPGAVADLSALFDRSLAFVRSVASARPGAA